MLVAETVDGQRYEFASLEEYERSWLWAEAKERYRGENGRGCFFCAEFFPEMHHRSYARCGRERGHELVPLCEAHHHMVEKVALRTRNRWDAHLILQRDLDSRARGELRPLDPAVVVGGGEG